MSTLTHPAQLSNGVWTSWLPVTTAWTSQAACDSAAWVRFGIDFTNNQWPYIYDPAYAQSVANTLTCLPPEATTWWDGASTVSGTVTIWSIGPIVCPAAYTTASTSVVSGTSTSVICCPTNFEFVRNLPENGGIDGVCTSIMTSGQRLTYASPTSNSFTSATTVFTTSALMIAVPVEGYNFAASTTNSSSSSSTSTTSQSSSTGPAAATDTNAQKDGLSGGAKIGIGVGVAGAALLVLAGVALLFFRRKRKHSLAGAPPELAGNGEDKSGPMAERYAELEPETTQRAEIGDTSRPIELQA